MLQGITQTSQGFRPNDIPGNPHVEEITQTLVEDHFGSDAGIAASKNRGERMLALIRQLRESGRSCGVRSRLPPNKTRVAVDQTPKSGRSRRRWRRWNRSKVHESEFLMLIAP